MNYLLHTLRTNGSRIHTILILDSQSELLSLRHNNIGNKLLLASYVHAFYYTVI